MLVQYQNVGGYFGSDSVKYTSFSLHIYKAIYAYTVCVLWSAFIFCLLNMFNDNKDFSFTLCCSQSYQIVLVWRQKSSYRWIKPFIAFKEFLSLFFCHWCHFCSPLQSSQGAIRVDSPLLMSSPLKNKAGGREGAALVSVTALHPERERGERKGGGRERSRSALPSDSTVSSIQSHSSGSDMGANSSNVCFLFSSDLYGEIQNRVSLAV